jgi:hypothetical protein
MTRKAAWFLFCLNLTLLTSMGESQSQIPPDYFLSEPSRLSFAEGGSALDSGISSIRINPAMLAFTPQYIVSGTYAWPSFGQSYYGAGIVDSTTSNIAAGVSTRRRHTDPSEANFASPIHGEVHVGFATKANRWILGFTANHYTFDHASPPADEESPAVMGKQTGYSGGLGIAYLWSPQIVVGGSYENIANAAIAHIAPGVLRVAGSYRDASGLMRFGFDYYRRQSLKGLETSFDETTAGAIFRMPQIQPEELRDVDAIHGIVASGIVQVYNLLYITGSYGRNLTYRENNLGAGISLNNPPFGIGYHLFAAQDQELSQGVQVDLSISF